jgi:hypothetical protein
MENKNLNSFGMHIDEAFSADFQQKLSELFSSISDGIEVQTSLVLETLEHLLPYLPCTDVADIQSLKPLVESAKAHRQEFEIGTIFHRWHLIPCLDEQYGVYLHRITDEDTRWPHDHPWDFISLVIEGTYTEHIVVNQSENGDLVYSTIARAGEDGAAFRKAEHQHYTRVQEGKEAWTVVFRQPVRRTWGFQTNQGWRAWNESGHHDGELELAGGLRPLIDQ